MAMPLSMTAMTAVPAGTTIGSVGGSISVGFRSSVSARIGAPRLRSETSPSGLRFSALMKVLSHSSTNVSRPDRAISTARAS